LDYARQVEQALVNEGLRVSLDASNERVNAKIKVAQERKVNYMLVVGGRDEKAGAVSVRDRSRGDLGAMPLDDFVRQVAAEAQSRGEQTVTV
ncbi:MAG: His/Gly/Thr/Pro-type tRNA ligase C-terminal domain-containing protein, partial [Phycisphaeraceae bacterium]|nr:His/Gly/Thr/Pro-type tRNA ligase C-terminal domain-containing protein [Phycisphaeraceae bacterium]